MAQTTDLLHVYAQPFNHAEAWLVGDREALTKLRDALNGVLGTKEPAGVQTYCMDGEGYTVMIVQAEAAQMEPLMLPYGLDAYGEPEHPKSGSSPCILMTKEKYRELVSKT
jgi:hypothetical protein